MGCRPWLLGSAALLIFLAGCATDQAAKPKAQPAAAKHPPAKAPAPSATPNKPAPAPDKPKAEKAKDESPPAKKTVEAKPAEGGQVPTNWGVQEGQTMTDQDREALAQMIRAAAEEGQKRQAAEQQQKKNAPPAPAATPAASAQPTPDGQAPKKEGCGATSGPAVDLTPLPEDQPQPKFACKQKKVVAEQAWQGKQVEFTFTVGNEGEAPLAIRLKGG
jgi:uncharacterized membrane protein